MSTNVAARAHEWAAELKSLEANEQEYYQRAAVMVAQLVDEGEEVALRTVRTFLYDYQLPFSAFKINAVNGAWHQFHDKYARSVLTASYDELKSHPGMQSYPA